MYGNVLAHHRRRGQYCGGQEGAACWEMVIGCQDETAGFRIKYSVFSIIQRSYIVSLILSYLLLLSTVPGQTTYVGAKLTTDTN